MLAYSMSIAFLFKFLLWAGLTYNKRPVKIIFESLPHRGGEHKNKEEHEMGIILNIDDYRKKRITKDPFERAKEELRRILEPMGTWESNDEKIRYYMDLAEEDRKEWVG